MQLILFMNLKKSTLDLGEKQWFVTNQKEMLIGSHDLVANGRRPHKSLRH